MANFTDLSTITNDFSFQNRCMYAACVYAVNTVMLEQSNVTGHAARVAYALTVINGSASLVSIARMVLTNPTIAAEANVANQATGWNIPDSDIQFAVDNVYNALAGIPAA